ncbi:MAG: VOC family protein [Methylococcus sp.]
MLIAGIHHVSVTVRYLAVSRGFYEGLLGLEPRSDRPGDPAEGVWYRAGGQEIHLIVAGAADLKAGDPAAYPGRQRHVALWIHDLEALTRRLEEAGIPLTHSRSGRPVVFCRDPDGNVFELVGVREEKL